MRSALLSAILSMAALAVSPRASAAEVLAIVGATVLPSPTARPLPDAVVLMQGGKITAVGTRAEVPVPSGAEQIDGRGLTLAAGFWNCHVHFTGPEWVGADAAPRERLTEAMERMLTSRGFTSVVDAGSFIDNTVALRSRVESGEVPGPRILTAGGGLYPPGGIPLYLREALPAETLAHLPQPSTPAEARVDVARNLAAGADATKLFTGSWLGGDKTIAMPLDVVRAAADATHHAGKQVLAHPQMREGLLRALDGGVDVLMHTTPSSGVWEPALVSQLVAAHLALVPTLTLWSIEGRKARMGAARLEAFVQAGVAQLRSFATGGGEVLFGTDVGYTDAYDTSEELVRMAQAGLGWREILASLTTAPARRFGGGGSGTIAVGQPADLVLFSGDPVRNPRALSRVKITVRAGRVLYRASAPPDLLPMQ
jgi:imidazolonepropionase-like amidohydrolase